MIDRLKVSKSPLGNYFLPLTRPLEYLIEQRDQIYRCNFSLALRERRTSSGTKKLHRKNEMIGMLTQVENVNYKNF